MCKALNLNRSTYYYSEIDKKVDTELENAVIHEFYLSRRNFGTRKLKRQLARKQNGHEAIRVSRKRIGDIMKKYSLVSKYTLKHRKKRQQVDLRRIRIFHTDYTEEKTMPKNLLKPDGC